METTTRPSGAVLARLQQHKAQDGSEPKRSQGAKWRASPSSGQREADGEREGQARYLAARGETERESWPKAPVRGAFVLCVRVVVEPGERVRPARGRASRHESSIERRSSAPDAEAAGVEGRRLLEESSPPPPPRQRAIHRHSSSVL